jgi:hypothetical protein
LRVCFLPQNDSEQNSESLLIFLFHGPNHSELFSLPRNGSELNSESLLLFLFHGRKFRAYFSSTERFGTRNCESFLLCGTAGIPSEQTICFAYSVFRGIFFLSEIPNPRGRSILITHVSLFFQFKKYVDTVK